jgi:Peptidase A4 family
VSEWDSQDPSSINSPAVTARGCSWQEGWTAPDTRRSRVTSKRLLLAGSGIAVAGVLGLPGVALGAGFSGCDHPYDVYSVSASTLAACGVKTFPLSGTSATSDGGTAYHYNVRGRQISFMVPPARFNPATAKADELAMYGLPTRPPASQGVRQALWDSVVSKQSFPKPPQFLAEIPVKASTTFKNLNWSGYGDSGGAGAFTESTGVYVEPYDHGTSCAGNSAVFWVGLGGVNTGNLAQDGTGINTPGLGQHQAWKEILPENIIPVSLYATAGQPFKAQTHWLGNRYQFVLRNMYTGQSQTINVNSSSYDGSTSEFIGERPEVNGSFTTLTNFGSLVWQDAYSNSSPAQSFGNYDFKMYDNLPNGNLMATPSTGFGSSGGFTDSWERCN